MKKLLLALSLLCAVKSNAQVCFNGPTNYNTSTDPWGICKGDFNSDGHMDVATTNRSNGVVSVFFGSGTGTFSLNQNASCGNSPEGIAAADFNGDAKLDLVVANNGNNMATVLLNDGVGNFSMFSQTTTANGAKRVVAGDFDQNGQMDVAVSCSGSNAVSVLLGDGTGNFPSSLNVSVGSNPVGVCVGDFNNDNNLDFATANQSSNNISVLRGNGDGTFMTLNNYNTGGSGQFGITSAFLNADANVDLLIANFGSNNITLSMGAGNGVYGSGGGPVVNQGPRAIATGDFNADGKLDIAVCAFTSNQVYVFLGDGLGGLTSGTVFSVGQAPRDLVVADFNEDGKDDIVTANLNATTISVLLNTTPIVNVTGTMTVCNGTSTTLTAAGADTYTWSSNAGSATTATVALTPTTTTTYTVTGSSVGCAINVPATVTVAVNPVPTVQTLLAGPGTICEGQSTSIQDVGDGVNQVWMPGTLTGSLVTVSPTVTTTYTVTSSAGGTGCTSNGTIQVFVNPSPTVTINATATVVCSGNPVTLTANGASTYTWTGGISNGVVFSPTATVTYTVTATGSNSCTKTLSQMVAVNPLPTVNANASVTNICPGTMVTLTGSGTATSYTWSGGAINGTPIPATASVYTVTGMDANNCANTATISVLAPPPNAPNICTVTVDSLSLNNVIVWEKSLFANADSFYVYRDTANNNYAQIAALPYSALSQFTDTSRSVGAVNGDPNITTYRYKIAYRDTCGVMSPKSPYHGSIYQYNLGTSLFFWNAYEIEGQPVPVPGLSSYALQRDNVGATGNYVTAASAPASATQINDPQYGTWQATADWRVETVWSITCVPTQRLGNNGMLGAIVRSKSNITNNRTTGIKTLDKIVSMYPNPTNGNLVVDFGALVSGKLSIKVYSALGNEVYSIDLNSIEYRHSIDLSSNTKGMYLVQIITDAGVVTRKVLKN